MKDDKGQGTNRDFSVDRVTNRDFSRPQGAGSRDELDKDLDNDGDFVDQNEGEGSRTAARRYNEATEKYARSGKVRESARQAEEALDSDEASELRDAEKIGKQGPEKMISKR